MHDGAPFHRLNQTLACLESDKVCLLFDWLWQSPNLNSIVNILTIFNINVMKSNSSNKEMLLDVIVEEGHKILNDVIYKSLASIIKAKGANSK